MNELQKHESVLAIDPGNFATAYCILRGDRKLLGFGKCENRDFSSKLKALLEFGPPDIVSCEMIQSYGMSVGASVFETCVFIGQLKQLTAGRAPWVQVGRLEVKLAICHSPKANDSAIRTALIDLFGEQGTKKAPGPTYGISKDVWAALALAETVRSGNYRPYVDTHDREVQK